jgi:hypothetical protein
VVFGPFKRQLTTQEDLENLKNEINNIMQQN